MGNTDSDWVDHVAAWQQWMTAQGRSAETIEHYGRTIRRWVASIDDPVTVSGRDITAWLGQWQDRRPNTRRAYRSAIASLYRYLADAELIDHDPMARVPTVKVPIGIPRPITGDQLDRALATASPRMRRWLLLGADAGLRRAEISGLAPADIIGRRLHITGKGSKQRVVPVTVRLAAALESWEPETPVRMWTASPDRVGDLMSLHLHSCGVPATAHMLRHYAAGRYYTASGCDLLATQRFLGHASPTTTQVYVGWADEGVDIIDRMAS
jgi:integrase/recombinase XerC